MAALTRDRNTKSKFRQRRQSYKVAAATEIFAGSYVCLNAAGFLLPASDTSGLLPSVGRAAEGVNNTGAAGDLSCVVEPGVFKFANVDLVQANLGDLAQVTDDQTAEISGSNSIIAGLVLEIDADGDVWLAIGL